MKKKKDKTKSIVALIIAAAGLSFLFIKSQKGLAAFVPLSGVTEDFFLASPRQGLWGPDDVLVIGGCLCPGDPAYAAHFVAGGATCNPDLCTGPGNSSDPRFLTGEL